MEVASFPGSLQVNIPKSWLEPHPIVSSSVQVDLNGYPWPFSLLEHEEEDMLEIHLFCLFICFLFIYLFVCLFVCLFVLPWGKRKLDYRFSVLLSVSLKFVHIIMCKNTCHVLYLVQSRPQNLKLMERNPESCVCMNRFHIFMDNQHTTSTAGCYDLLAATTFWPYDLLTFCRLY